jgi:uncharacterized protein (AIM24 family)
MTTDGIGTLLVNAFGSIKKIELQSQEITIDNAHVVAWSDTLDYNIHLENGLYSPLARVKVSSTPSVAPAKSTCKALTLKPLPTS